ncbi:MAG TPA: RNA-binding domain-containing protein [Candidatus Sulfopaludibacter sp.]|jgi:uncharacterized protein|nr:RNA-binding domain-containing protein [Candidatus Sulfopaludibacter sp.]
MNNENKYNNKDLEIIVQTYVNPSEDLEKVTSAIRNIFPDAKVILKDSKIQFSTKKLEELKKIKDQIRSRSTISVLKKVLYNNQHMNITWFLLNKQASFSGVVVIVEEEDESPLGPIKITIKNQDIEETINWFEH